MSQVCVDSEFVKSILGAVYSTALAHRNQPDEMYALGALEATANLFYIMAINADNNELELLCHKFASDALDRYEEIRQTCHLDSGLRTDEVKISKLS